jgi:hypothetical protein
MGDSVVSKLAGDDELDSCSGVLKWLAVLRGEFRGCGDRRAVDLDPARLRRFQLLDGSTTSDTS